MTLRHATRFLVAIATFAMTMPALFGVEIDPPFKLSWGEAPMRLERLLAGAGAKIVSKHPAADGTEAWEVEGIVQDGLKRTVFYFRAATLVGVELQYRNDAWTQEKYDDFMGRWRRTIEQRYGQGQLIARKTEPKDEVTQTIVGYKWNHNNTSLDLVFFSAQSATGQTFRTLSVHYKGS
jgi:hypothetical protein